MQEKIISSTISVCEYSELSADDQFLVDEARRATGNAYAPYSHFHVGAAVRLASGEVLIGANQENAAFTAGTCAERSVLFYVGANRPGVAVKQIAVTAFTKGDFVEMPCAPCGHCRQAILEYETISGEPIELLLIGRKEIYRVKSIRDLLPLCFDSF